MSAWRWIIDEYESWPHHPDGGLVLVDSGKIKVVAVEHLTTPNEFMMKALLSGVIFTWHAGMDPTGVPMTPPLIMVDITLEGKPQFRALLSIDELRRLGSTWTYPDEE